MFGLSDHDLLMWAVGVGIYFLVMDAIWKIFGTQRRLNKIEKLLRSRGEHL